VIYDYECPNCGKQFEEWNSVANRNLANCPDCGTPAVKVISRSVAVHLWKPYLDTNISDKPVYLESRQQRKDLIKANGLIELG